MAELGKTSQQRLSSTHPLIQELCQQVVAVFDITIIWGHRNKAEQDAAFLSGASTKPWPHSTHNTFPSNAVDPAPWPLPEGWGDLKSKTPNLRDLEWKERVKFYQMVTAFKICWQQMCDDFPEIADNFDIRFGADWDGDNDYRDQSFDDLVHIEIMEKTNG